MRAVLVQSDDFPFSRSARHVSICHGETLPGNFEFSMRDRPPNPESSRFIDSSREYRSAEQRAAAWQQEFQRERGAFRSAFEHAAIGIALVDLDARYLTVNRSLCQIVGYSEEELLAINAYSIIHPDDQKACQSWGRRLLDGEIDHYHMEQRLLHKQGHIVWIQLSASIVRDDAGDPCYFVGQIQDISARKAAEHESARRLRHVERLTRTVSRILRALESTPDDTFYCEVLRILLDSFQSQTGVFLRFAEDEVLVGPYSSAIEQQDMRYRPGARCELWDTALREETGLIENTPRWMVCDKRLSRSLVAPIRHAGVPLGVFHIGDAETDYNADDLDILTRISSMIAPLVSARMERDKLTPREAEIMDLIVSGKTQKRIAAILDVSIQTAARHRSKVLEKLHVGNDAELVHFALRMRKLAS